MTFGRRHARDLADIKVLQLQADDRIAALLEGIDDILKTQGDHDHELVAFVHIPKTAGGTVKSMLTAGRSGPVVVNTGNFLREPEGTVLKLSSGRLVDGRVAIGHVPYGLYRKHLERGVRYMTFLREPVDRVISHYYRHIHIDRSDGRRRALDREAKIEQVKADSLEEALADLHLPDVNNLQTRFLCRDPAPLGPLPDSALLDAKANLCEFAFVGIQERFPESVALMKRALGLDLAASEDQHVGTNRPTVEDLAPGDRALIEEHNRFDMELYRFARALFEQRLPKADEAFTSDVEALREASEAANREHQATLEAAAEWLDRARPLDARKLDEELREAAEAAGFTAPLLKRAAQYLAERGDSVGAPRRQTA